MLGKVGNEHRRLIPIHEDRLRKVFPSRLTDKGLQVVEIALADDKPRFISPETAEISVLSLRRQVGTPRAKRSGISLLRGCV